MKYGKLWTPTLTASRVKTNKTFDSLRNLPKLLDTLSNSLHSFTKMSKYQRNYQGKVFFAYPSCWLLSSKRQSIRRSRECLDFSAWIAVLSVSPCHLDLDPANQMLCANLQFKKKLINIFSERYIAIVILLLSRLVNLQKPHD